MTVAGHSALPVMPLPRPSAPAPRATIVMPNCTSTQTEQAARLKRCAYPKNGQVQVRLQALSAQQYT